AGQEAVEFGDDRGVVRRGGTDEGRHGCPGFWEVVNQSLFYARTAPAARTHERDMDLARYLRTIPDFPKPGIQFKDITPLLADPAAFRESIRQMIAQLEGRTIDAIAAAEARGFLFAAPLAYVMNKPLVPLRKPGKLPYQTHRLQ